MDGKRAFIRYLIGPNEFAQLANTWDIVGPLTMLSEAQTRIVSKRRADTVIDRSTVGDTVSGPTKLFPLDIVTDPIST